MVTGLAYKRSNIFSKRILAGKSPYRFPEVLLSVLGGDAAIVENLPYFNRQCGTQGYFEGRYSSLCDHDNRIIGGLAVIHDSTERKWAEEKLLESEKRFKMVMHQLPAAIEVYDLNGLLIGVNRAYEDS